jgi:hypothetical protein
MDNSKMIYINILLIVVGRYLLVSISNNQRYQKLKANAHLPNDVIAKATLLRRPSLIPDPVYFDEL